MKRAYVVSFGLGGHSVETAETARNGVRVKGSISGYDSPAVFERALAQGEKSSYPPLAGVSVLDKRAVLRERPSLALRSPLLDVDLADGVVDRFDTHAARWMLPGLSGGFALLAAHAIHEARSDSPEPGPLDSVSLREYLAWWIRAGARLGHLDEDGLKIVWDDEREDR